MSEYGLPEAVIFLNNKDLMVNWLSNPENTKMFNTDIKIVPSDDSGIIKKEIIKIVKKKSTKPTNIILHTNDITCFNVLKRLSNVSIKNEKIRRLIRKHDFVFTNTTAKIVREEALNFVKALDLDNVNEEKPSWNNLQFLLTPADMLLEKLPTKNTGLVLWFNSENNNTTTSIFFNEAEPEPEPEPLIRSTQDFRPGSFYIDDSKNIHLPNNQKITVELLKKQYIVWAQKGNVPIILVDSKVKNISDTVLNSFKHLIFGGYLENLTIYNTFKNVSQVFGPIDLGLFQKFEGLIHVIDEPLTMDMKNLDEKQEKQYILRYKCGCKYTTDISEYLFAIDNQSSKAILAYLEKTYID